MTCVHFSYSRYPFSIVSIGLIVSELRGKCGGVFLCLHWRYNHVVRSTMYNSHLLSHQSSVLFLLPPNCILLRCFNLPVDYTAGLVLIGCISAARFNLCTYIAKVTLRCPVL
jgi:hypothetical protein